MNLTPYEITCDIIMLAGVAYLWAAWWKGRKTND